MRRQFVLREDHIKLLRRAYVEWDDCETGAPAINPKRPYGNSSVAMDVAKILGVAIPDEDEDGAKAWRQWQNETRGKMLEIHRETETALQVVLSAGTFEPGTYRLRSEYGHDWQRDPAPAVSTEGGE